jgi:uncharacterized membrane protein YbhN (UPF0104 family)
MPLERLPGAGLFRRLRGLFRMRVLIPAIIAAGMLAYVSYAASARNSGPELLNVLQQTWVLFLLLMFPYLLCRLLVWYQLLRELRVDVPLRHLVVAFAGGEMTKSLPAGIYVENLILERVERLSRVETVRSTGATTAMLGLETALAVPAIVIIGLPGMSWVRWAVIGVVVVWLLILVAVRFLVSGAEERLTLSALRWLRKAAMIVDDFLQAGVDLVQPRTALSLIPTAAYMLIYVVYLAAITLALGIHRLNFIDLIAVYAVVVLAVVLVPIPTEIGLAEFSGLGALQAFGVQPAMAALMVVALRIEATGATILVSLIAFLVFRRGLHSRRTGSIEEQSGQPQTAGSEAN